MNGAEKLLQNYYSDNAKKLHKLVDSILKRFGGIYQKDFADRAENKRRAKAQRG